MTTCSISCPTQGTTRRPEGASLSCAAREATGAATSAIARSRMDDRTGDLLPHAPLQLREKTVGLRLTRRPGTRPPECIDLLGDVRCAVQHRIQLSGVGRQ